MFSELPANTFHRIHFGTDAFPARPWEPFRCGTDRAMRLYRFVLLRGHIIVAYPIALVNRFLKKGEKHADILAFLNVCDIIYKKSYKKR